MERSNKNDIIVCYEWENLERSLIQMYWVTAKFKFEFY